jgi:DNA anti-recombination protein RmuC
MNDIWAEAMQKKVIFAGPFSFTAILRMVRQAHENFRYQENIQQIVSHIRQFEKQFDLYSEEFEKLGSQLATVQNTYQKVDSTRSKQLSRIVEKIKLESGDSEKAPSLPIVEVSDDEEVDVIH